ncbi:hypothetical protein JTB14_027692 [Gonioctena quinquepunctata]|nr:hypothetical protein JTB14_027692 [Gonioctena quinquepunctata]
MDQMKESEFQKPAVPQPHKRIKFRTSASSSSDTSGSTNFLDESEPKSQTTPNRKRKRLSPQEANQKRIQRDEKIKSNQAKPCDCGGTTANICSYLKPMNKAHSTSTYVSLKT